MRIIESLAKLCAIVGGVLLTAITLLTCVSLLGRNTIGTSIVGDFELTGAAAGAAIALFLPWCQLAQSNIIVDFFTTRAAPSTREALDRLGALFFAGVMALLTWRTGVGGLKAWESQSGSMMLGFPEWITYAFMVPPLALCVLIGLLQALRGAGEPIAQ
jgi:TRAP-type C4-dicarboxylate transport system permease small subunit